MLSFFSERLKKKGYNPQLVVSGYLFVIPVLAFVIIFVIFPMFATFGLSFFEYDGIRPPRFVGWENFINVFRDPDTWQSLKVTLYYLVGTLPIAIILGFWLATLLTDKWFEKCRGVLLSIYFLPYIIAYVAVGILWAWLFDPLTGVANYLLSLMGINPLYWLRDPIWAMPSIFIIATWKHLGWFLVLYITAIQSISKTYYEAASIDGISTKWQEIRYITWPLVRPTTFFLLTMGFISALSVFDIVYVTTGGGPASATKVIVLKIYEDAFLQLKFGRASAMTVILVAMMLVAVWYQWKYYTSVVEES